MSTDDITGGKFECGVSDRLGTSDAQWPRACLDVDVAFRFSSIPLLVAVEAFERAIDMWNRACGIRLVLEDVELSKASIWATDGTLPGPTLAWSGFPNNRCSGRVEQRYDSGPRSMREVEFLAKVVGHELGHAIGLGHTASRADLMYRSIDGTRAFSFYPSATDKAGAVSLYGPSVGSDPPRKRVDVRAVVHVDGVAYTLTTDGETAPPDGNKNWWPKSNETDE